VTDLVLAGRHVGHAEDHVRRYCGLPWSGGDGETWAYRYFDAVSDLEPDTVTAVDVLAAGALSVGLSKADLTWFWTASAQLDALLAELPKNVQLADADGRTVELVQSLARMAAGSDSVSVSLLSKVLHRKRPALIPMLDKATQDHYRAQLPTRGEAAYPSLVTALQADLRSNQEALERLDQELSAELDATITPLRIVDIAIWMSQHSRRTK
jgi:hypothetical protein